MDVQQCVRRIEEFIENNFYKEPTRKIVEWLKTAGTAGPEWVEAAEIVAASRGLSLRPGDEPKPPDRSKPVPYDADEHLLLRDEAHQCRIYRAEEFDTFLSAVRSAGLELFQVICPEWPPVPRSPLAMLMSTGGGAAAGPFDGKPWVGTHWAVEQCRESRKVTLRIGREIVPLARENDHDRVAYAWQVRCFNPGVHVPLREWCAVNGLDIADVLNSYHARGLDDAIVTTVNPFMLQEQQSGGSYSPRVMCIEKAQLPRFEGAYLGGRPSGSVSVPMWPGWPYISHANDDDIIPGSEWEPIPRAEAEDVEDVRPKEDWSFLDVGAKVYTDWQVHKAIMDELPNARFFGGRPLDPFIVGITQDALQWFLNRDRTDKMTYVRDIGGKSFDCDDYAVMLRAAMSRTGIHPIGIIGGDTHCWNIVVVAGDDDEPDIIFIEGKTDGVVTALEGLYSVKNRCEIFL